MPAKVVIQANGRPEIRINHSVNGTMHRKSVKDPVKLPTIEVAERIAAAINAALDSGTFDWQVTATGVAKPQPDWTFERYAQHWLSDNEALLKAATRRFYADHLTRYLYPAMGQVAIGAVDRALCRSVVKGLLKLRGTRTRRPLAMKTREGIWHTMGTVLNGALDDEVLDVNPAMRLGKYLGPDRRTLEKAIHPYTFEEMEIFLSRVKALARHYYPFFFVAFRTGLRQGELRELRWAEDFPPHRPTQIHVQRSFSYPQYVEDLAAGLPKERAGIATPKSGRDRYVDQSAQVIAVLQSHRLAQKEAAFKTQQPLAALCFTAPRGGRVQPRVLLEDIIPHVCTAPLAGVPPVRAITLHAIRHTFVTLMLLKHGIQKLPAISQQIGHRDPSTTERHYAHWIVEHREALSQALDEPVATVVPFPVVAQDGGDQ